MADPNRARIAIALLLSSGLHAGLLAGLALSGSGRDAAPPLLSGEGIHRIRAVPTPPPSLPPAAPLEPRELAREPLDTHLELSLPAAPALLPAASAWPSLPQAASPGREMATEPVLPPPIAAAPPEPLASARQERIALPEPPAAARESRAGSAAPLPLARIDPGYPRRCRILGHEGTALLTCRVGADGRVREARVLQSAGCPELDREARKALLEARFAPAQEGGVPVESTIDEVPIRFSLEPW
jgi:protein TonB